MVAAGLLPLIKMGRGGKGMVANLRKIALFFTAVLISTIGFYAGYGCGGGSSSNIVVNSELPYVISVSPADGATGVVINPTIEVVFSKEMDASSINAGAFFLSTYDAVETAKALVVDVSVQYDYSSKMAMFSISSDLNYKTTYVATVSGQVRDTEGNAMGSDFTWSFTTADAEDPSENEIVFSAEPDPDFGTDGLFSHDVNGLGNVEYASNVLFQPDDKILISSYINWTNLFDYCAPGGCFWGDHNADLGVVRVDENGVLDPTFGVGGVAEVGCNSFWGVQWWLLHGLALQSDGKILVGGECERHARIFRLNDDGSIDLTFNAAGTPGYAEIEPDIGGGGSNWAGVFSIAMQPDGLGGEKILVGGISNTVADWAVQPAWLFARFNLDGTLDATFGLDPRYAPFAHQGILVETWGTIHNDGIRDMAVLADRGIIAYGNSSHGNPANIDFAMARYSADGVLDTTFSAGDADGVDGLNIIDFGGSDWGYSMAVAPDGKLVGGEHVNCCAPTNDFGVFRLTSDGALDSSFGAGGKVQIDFGRSDADIGNAVVVLPDGSVIVGGSSNNAIGDSDFALVMLTPDGAIDTNFGTDGFILTDFYGSSDTILKMKLADVETNADGDIVSFKLLAVGAATHPGSKPDLAMARYRSVAHEVPAE